MNWPTRTPKVTPRGQSKPITPLKDTGAISIKYIGTTPVISPVKKKANYSDKFINSSNFVLFY